MNKKALIAMSGGVDSCVAAYITKTCGYTCSGATMRLYDKDTNPSSDIDDARSVCDRLGIEFHLFDFRDEFKECVIDSFISSYENGDTPNPCIECNRHMKFGRFLNEAINLGMDYIVTGHYAATEKSGSRYFLKKGSDSAKDQSYFLYNLTQFQLSHTLFPLGTMTKPEIRRIAEENGFVTARKKDSQDICFVPDGDYISVIKRFTDKHYPCGNFVDKHGKILGTHSGLINYTIGQRKGLGCAFGERLYVSDKNIATNEVVLVKNDELFSSSLDAKDFNWIAFDTPPEKLHTTAKIRYSANGSPATVYLTGEGTVHIEFDSPQRAIASGQSVVLYDGDYVVGGGIIS